MEFQVEKYLPVSLMDLVYYRRACNCIKLKSYFKNLYNIPEPVDQLNGIIIFRNIEGEY